MHPGILQPFVPLHSLYVKYTFLVCVQLICELQECDTVAVSEL